MADANSAGPSGDTVILGRYYTGEKTQRQTYDLVIPAGASGSAGLILCIHGGGWTEGGKEEYTGALKQVSKEKGLAAAAINYRFLSDTVGFEEILSDVTAALAAIRAEGLRHGVSFDRALLTGISAGGHIALLYAYARRETSPVKPVCVVELCGPTDLEDGFYYSGQNAVAEAAGPDYFPGLISRGVKQPVPREDPASSQAALKKYSPIRYVDHNAVPTVFGHGERDAIVPYRNAVDLDAALTACGAEHTFVSFPDSGHGCEDRASMKKIMALFFDCAEKYLR